MIKILNSQISSPSFPITLKNLKQILNMIISMWAMKLF